MGCQWARLVAFMRRAGSGKRSKRRARAKAVVAAARAARVHQQTAGPTEAELEAEIRAAIRRAFPWIPAGAIRHQIKFSFAFGRARVEVDGAKRAHATARVDVLLYWGEQPLAVLELKRKGVALTSADDEQGLSYARMLHPRPPLVVVTNGQEIRFLETHSGGEWKPEAAPEKEFSRLVEAAARVAGEDLKRAIETLMGSSPSIWVQAIRQATDVCIGELITSSATAAGRSSAAPSAM